MIGKVIKKMRIEKGYSQFQLSKLVDIGQNNISRYETMERQITFDLLEKIADYCDYEIIFKNKKTKKQFTSDQIKRDI